MKDTRIVPVRRLKISLSILSLIALATLLYVAAETEEIAPLARAHLERAESTLRAFDVPVEARIRFLFGDFDFGEMAGADFRDKLAVRNFLSFD